MDTIGGHVHLVLRPRSSACNRRKRAACVRSASRAPRGSEWRPRSRRSRSRAFPATRDQWQALIGLKVFRVIVDRVTARSTLR